MDSSWGQVSFAYDLAGRLAGVSTGAGVGLEFGYDGFLEKEVSFTGPVRGQIQRVFDADFRVVGHKVNGQLVASYSFDGDGLLVQAGDLALSRDSQTGFVVASRAGVVEEARSYNGFGELVEQVWRASGVPILVERFQRDGLGRVVGKEEEQGGQLTRWEYGYDGAGRLVLEHKILADGSVLESHWSYDANGNRLSERRPDGSLLTASYDAQDRILSYGDFTFTHSHNGELVSKCQGSFCRSFVYDVFGNLRQVVMDSGQVIEYLVDGRNRRVGKRVDGVLVQGFLYDDQLRILAELDGGSNVVATFVYGEGINVPELMVKGGRTYRLVKDHLGSVRLVVDTWDGTIMQEMRYDAWGNVVLDTNPGFQPFGFAGGLYDPQTRLLRFGARDYDASIGRWMGKDPIRFLSGTTNFFDYASNDPLDYRDPSGLTLLVCRRPVDLPAGLGDWLSQEKKVDHWFFYSTNAQKGCGLGPESSSGAGWSLLSGLCVPGKIEWESPFDEKGQIRSGYECFPWTAGPCVEKCVIEQCESDDKHGRRYCLGGKKGMACFDYIFAVYDNCCRCCGGCTQ